VAALALATTWASSAHAGDGVVTASESIVHTAPFEVAPEMARLHAGDKVTADDQPSGAWRRVRLPDGRMGLMHDADIQVTGVHPTAPGAAAPQAPTPPASPVPVVAAAPSQPAAGTEVLAGLMVAVMPAGKFSTGTSTGSSSSDATTATAVAPFIDLAATPNVSVGFSPQIILHVKPEGVTDQSATEYDLRLRLTAKGAIAPNASVYMRFSPAYSIIDLPSSASDANVSLSNPKGFLLDFSVGCTSAPGWLCGSD
jgi:hypothetical protein